MKYRTFVVSALAALSIITGLQVRADNMASIAIAPATGAVTLTPRWNIGSGLGGFHHMAQDLGLGGAANNFYSIKGGSIPAGGDILAFNLYTAASGAATPHADIGSKLTPNSYSALTSADPDVGYGSVNFYLIHHKGTTDYFTAIIPGSAVASAVSDKKPMSGPGGPGTVTGVSGYFGLTFASANLGYGLNLFYYLRTDPATGFTKFGSLEPALLGTSADRFDLGVGGHNALAFTGTDVGYGTNKMYYLRLDSITGFTVLGTLHPTTGRASDIANLGSVYSTLTFVPGDLGFGSSRFYTTGAVNPTWQSVSFAAIDDRLISAGSFTVTPSASSALPITLTVVAGSTGSASISGPVGGVFTVTPTAPGVITLQASQAGSGSFESNMLRQRFTASGVATLAITTQPAARSAAVGSSASFSVTAAGSSAVSYQWRKAGANITGNASATTATLTLANVQVSDGASYDVVVTNASGSISSNSVLLTVTTAASTAPVITNTTLSTGSTVGTAFSFTITAANSPTSYTASPLPAGLSLAAATGVISGTPTTAGVTTVVLGAANATGTGNATLTITVAAVGAAPIFTSPAAAPATAGTPVTYVIAATGSPTTFSATGLPPGLTLNAQTGVITGTPTTAGTYVVAVTATNAAGVTASTVTFTVAAAAVVPIAPVITSPTTSGGALGAPFGPYQIAATGGPTSYTATGLPAGLSVNAATGAISGTPTVAGTFNVTITATNATGTSTATLTIVLAAGSSRIVNFSARALSGPGSQTLIMGFVVAGDNKNLLVRGIGPTLASYGVANALVDPMLTLYNPLGVVATNDDWQTSTAISAGPDTSGPAIAATAARVGAFALPNASKDSALLFTVNNGAHTTGLLRPNSTAGIALVEIYDTDVAAGSRLVNVSARMNVALGDGSLIAGFAIAGNAPTTVVIRGTGPALSAYAVTGVLADPQITVYSGNTVIASNDNWETGTSTALQMSTASAQVGAFPLAAGSKDAALVVTLQPGVYSVLVTGVGNTTGVALIEIYDTQP